MGVARTADPARQHPRPGAPEHRDSARAPRALRVRHVMAACIALALLSGALGACGRKGPPRPPELVRPTAVDDLAATPVAAGIRLTWTRPTTTVDGSDMPDLDGFRVERVIATEPPTPPLRFAIIATIHLDDRERFSKTRRMMFEDHAVVAGTRYVYRIVTFTLDDYVSLPSAEARARWSGPSTRTDTPETSPADE